MYMYIYMYSIHVHLQCCVHKLRQNQSVCRSCVLDLKLKQNGLLKDVAAVQTSQKLYTCYLVYMCTRTPVLTICRCQWYVHIDYALHSCAYEHLHHLHVYTHVVRIFIGKPESHSRAYWKKHHCGSDWSIHGFKYWNLPEYIWRYVVCKFQKFVCSFFSMCK